MPLETGVTGIQDLNAAWPTGTDPKSQGDDHIRNVKTAVQGSFPNMTGANTIGSTLTVADPTLDGHAATKGYVDARTPSVDMGWIGGDASIINFFGTGFSVQKVDIGIYDIDFLEPWANQVVIAQVYSIGSNLLCANYERRSDQRARIRTMAYYDATIGDAAIDSAFQFIRYGWE